MGQPQARQPLGFQSVRILWRGRPVGSMSALAFEAAFLVFGVLPYMHVDGVRGTVAWT